MSDNLKNLATVYQNNRAQGNSGTCDTVLMKHDDGRTVTVNAHQADDIAVYQRQGFTVVDALGKAEAQ